VRAVGVRETGGPEGLGYEEVDPPEPGDAEVLVRVRAASVNPIDWKYRRGIAQRELPAVLGNDISGTIESSRAEGFVEGDDVFGWAASGGYAEIATASADRIARKPDAVTHEQAAAIPVAGLTAWQGLFEKGGLEAGQRALVTGAAGGVGHFAVQRAKDGGAYVIGTGSSRNRDFVLGLGADEYVDYAQQDVAEAVRDVDVALDTVGGEVTQSVVATVREGGIVVTIASAPPEDAARERGARAELLVTSPNSDQLTRIADLVASEAVRVEIADVLSLTKAARAHEQSESGHTRGKIILTP